MGTRIFRFIVQPHPLICVIRRRRYYQSGQCWEKLFSVIPRSKYLPDIDTFLYLLPNDFIYRLAMQDVCVTRHRPLTRGKKTAKELHPFAAMLAFTERFERQAGIQSTCRHGPLGEKPLLAPPNDVRSP